MVLHRLVDDEGVAPGSIAVLTGLGLEHSAVWAHRRYGNQVLWNGAADDDGRRWGWPPRTSRSRRRTSSCASRSVGSRAWSGRSSCCWRCRATTRSGWIGCCTSGRSRARQHLVVIVPLAVIRRLTTLSS